MYIDLFVWVWAGCAGHTLKIHTDMSCWAPALKKESKSPSDRVENVKKDGRRPKGPLDALTQCDTPNAFTLLSVRNG